MIYDRKVVCMYSTEQESNVGNDPQPSVIDPQPSFGPSNLMHTSTRALLALWALERLTINFRAEKINSNPAKCQCTYLYVWSTWTGWARFSIRCDAIRKRRIVNGEGVGRFEIKNSFFLPDSTAQPRIQIKVIHTLESKLKVKLSRASFPNSSTSHFLSAAPTRKRFLWLISHPPDRLFISDFIDP